MSVRPELLEREKLARGLAGDAAVDRVLAAAKGHNLPRGESGLRPDVDRLLLPTAKVTAGTVRLALREAPLVVVVLIAVFLGSEAWQFFARLDGAQYAKVMGGFVVIIAVILLFGLRDEWNSASTIPDEPLPVSDVEEPLVAVGFGSPRAGLRAPWLSRWMVGLKQVARLVLESGVVGALAAALFVILGAIGVSPELAGSWATRVGEQPNHHANVLFDIPILGKHAEPVTSELLLVSGAIGAIAALAFSVELVTGERLREELLRKRFAGYGAAFRAWARLHHGEPPAPPES